MTPVISRSMATKSADRTRRRRSARAEAKLDLVTCLRWKAADCGGWVEVEVVEKGRLSTRESAILVRWCLYFILRSVRMVRGGAKIHTEGIGTDSNY